MNFKDVLFFNQFKNQPYFVLLANMALCSLKEQREIVANRISSLYSNDPEVERLTLLQNQLSETIRKKTLETVSIDILKIFKRIDTLSQTTDYHLLSDELKRQVSRRDFRALSEYLTVLEKLRANPQKAKLQRRHRKAQMTVKGLFGRRTKHLITELLSVFMPKVVVKIIVEYG